MTESGMHATTDPADAFAAALPPHAPSDDAMTALYRAALGPVHPERYLALFARFDATGRATTGWNWAASLCTLNWMVFRKLWSAALVYVAAAESLALLVWGVGRAAMALGVPLDPFAFTVLVLLAALPSASNVSLLAERFGAHNGRIARIILVSTALAFLSFSAAVALLT